MTRHEALCIIRDLFGMNRQLLLDTIMNDKNSTNPNDYSDEEIIKFAKIQMELFDGMCEE